MDAARSHASPLIEGGADPHFRFTPKSQAAPAEEGRYANDWVRIVHQMHCIRRVLPK